MVQIVRLSFFYFIFIVIFLPTTSFAGFKIQNRVKDYSVEGNSLHQLHASIQTNAPETSRPEYKGKWQGWLVEWHYTFKTTSLSCRIDTIDIQVTTEIPKAIWSNDDNSPDTLKKAWDDEQYALSEYQKGHIDLAIEAGKMIEKKLSKLGSYANCTLLSQQAETKAHHVIENYIKKHHAYDDKTKFGSRIVGNSTKNSKP